MMENLCFSLFFSSRAEVNELSRSSRFSLTARVRMKGIDSLSFLLFTTNVMTPSLPGEVVKPSSSFLGDTAAGRQTLVLFSLPPLWRSIFFLQFARLFVDFLCLLGEGDLPPSSSSLIEVYASLQVLAEHDVGLVVFFLSFPQDSSNCSHLPPDLQPPFPCGVGFDAKAAPPAPPDGDPSRSDFSSSAERMVSQFRCSFFPPSHFFFPSFVELGHLYIFLLLEPDAHEYRDDRFSFSPCCSGKAGRRDWFFFCPPFSTHDLPDLLCETQQNSDRDSFPFCSSTKPTKAVRALSFPFFSFETASVVETSFTPQQVATLGSLPFPFRGTVPLATFPAP